MRRTRGVKPISRRLPVIFPAHPRTHGRDHTPLPTRVTVPERTDAGLRAGGPGQGKARSHTQRSRDKVGPFRETAVCRRHLRGSDVAVDGAGESARPRHCVSAVMARAVFVGVLWNRISCAGAGVPQDRHVFCAGRTGTRVGRAVAKGPHGDSNQEAALSYVPRSVWRSSWFRRVSSPMFPDITDVGLYNLGFIVGILLMKRLHLPKGALQQAGE
jgi:hypothetical protein